MAGWLYSLSLFIRTNTHLPIIFSSSRWPLPPARTGMYGLAESGVHGCWLLEPLSLSVEFASDANFVSASLCNWTLRPPGSSCCPLPPPPSQPSHIYTPPILSPAHSHMGASNLSLATLHYSILHISLLTTRAVYLCVQLCCNAHIWFCSSIWLNQK